MKIKSNIHSLGYLLVFLLTLSCDDTEPNLLTEDLVEEVHAYDLGNNGNASDIRVDFKVKDNLNVDEYRVFVVPAESKNLVDEEVLDKAPKESYWEVMPESGFVFEYTIQRLPEDLLDINGASVRNDKNYVVVILVIADSERQLSPTSDVFALTDVGIYSGFYLVDAEYGRAGTWGTQYQYDSAQITGTESSYSGMLWGHLRQPECQPSPELGTLSFTIDGTQITNFQWGTYYVPGGTCERSPTTITGGGVILSEIELKFEGINPNHVLIPQDQPTEDKMNLVRQR